MQEINKQLWELTLIFFGLALFSVGFLMIALYGHNTVFSCIKSADNGECTLTEKKLLTENSVIFPVSNLKSTAIEEFNSNKGIFYLLTLTVNREELLFSSVSDSQSGELQRIKTRIDRFISGSDIRKLSITYNNTYEVIQIAGLFNIIGIIILFSSLIRYILFIKSKKQHQQLHY